MSERVYEVSGSRVYEAPRSLLWGIVADSNRWDRASGMTPGTYRFEDVDGRWMRTGRSRELGFPVAWVEPAYDWVEGYYVHGERRFTEGPGTRGGLTVELTDAGEGRTRVRATFMVGLRGSMAPLLAVALKSRFRRAMDRYLSAVAEVLSPLPGDVPDDPSAPAVVRVQRLLSRHTHPVTSGSRSEADVGLLEQRAEELRRVGVDEGMTRQLSSLLLSRPDEELADLRPFELATRWERDRREVLRAFLQATVVGLFDLRWKINCPVCRVSMGDVGSLEEVASTMHCAACRIDYEIDFGDHVEACFLPNPAIRRVTTAVYCASSPSFRPHVLAQATLVPGGRFESGADLPRSELLVRRLFDHARARLDIEVPGTLVVRVTDGELDVRFEPGEEDRVCFENESSDDATVLVERAGFRADAVLGSVVASFPEFLDLFATEAPAAGKDLSVSKLALLFSDLTGSTAMYEHVGDARAFATVQEHFGLMDDIVRRHDGAVVKTMGDAVMATFASPRSAVLAAVEMVRAHESRFQDPPLGLKLGVHVGPCLAVRANERLDFFGTTVNVAARLQGKAASGEIVLMESVAADPTIAPLLGDLPRRAFETDLKGIREEQRLVAVDARGSAITESRASPVVR